MLDVSKPCYHKMQNFGFNIGAIYFRVTVAPQQSTCGVRRGDGSSYSEGRIVGSIVECVYL